MIYNDLKNSSPERLTYSEKLFLHRPAGGRNQTMEIITITADNIDSEHICCAVSDKKDSTGANAKKSWMKDRFQDGLVFRRLDARGKVFIEYIPAEKACIPSWRMATCISTVSGYPASLRDRVMPISCFPNVLRMPGHRGSMASPSFPLPKRSPIYLIRIS